MPMFNAGEMAVLRKRANQVLISTCDIQRRMQTSDNAGGSTLSFVTVYTDVKARLSPVRNDFEQERIIAERFGANVTWILSLPIGTDVRLLDRVTMTGYGNPMEVQAVLTEPRSIATVIRTVVIETK